MLVHLIYKIDDLSKVLITTLSIYYQLYVLFLHISLPQFKWNRHRNFPNGTYDCTHDISSQSI